MCSSEHHQPPALDPAFSNAQSLMQYNHNDTNFLSSEPLTVVVASGPYTLDDSPHYEVLADLFKAWMDVKPDLIIMVRSFFQSCCF